MTSRLPVPRFQPVEEVGFNRRAFLWRTGTLGAAATIALYPQIARAAGALDPILDQIAKPAMDVLARDTISGLVAFQVPGGDRYSQAQGVTSPNPGGIDAKATDVFLTDLDEFLPVPETYAHALAASLTTSVSDLPLPLSELGVLGQLGEGLAAQMDDALRALLESDTGVPLSLVIALMLNFLATQVNPTSLLGPFTASPFANLKFAEKAQAFALLEGGDAQLIATLDDNAPEPLKDSLSGLLKFVGGALQEFGTYLSYTEWGVLDQQTKTLTGRPVGWDLSNYQPGRTTQVDGWDEFLGYFQNRQSTSTAPQFQTAGPAMPGGAAGSGGTGGTESAGGAAGVLGANSKKKHRKHHHKHRRRRH
jgi:hypothetical protein